MSTTIVSEQVMASPQDSSSSSSSSSSTATASPNPNPTIKSPNPTSQIVVVQSATCDCCGFTEDCTPEYIRRIRETIVSEQVMVSPQDSSSSSSSSSSTATASPNPNPTTKSPNPTSQIVVVQSATCDCCGLTEDCTPEYIRRIRERFAGRWICGLCSEAVKEEIVRSGAGDDRLISPEEAVLRCRKLRLSSMCPDTDPTAQLIAAVRIILRRSLDGRGGMRSTPASPFTRKHEVAETKRSALARSESCFPDISS